MKNLVFITLITISSLFEGFGQINDYGSVSVPTPDVATFTKFIDNPVSEFNGSVALDIPIYSIKSGGIEVPINLRYNTTGIKVSEESGVVGLGWNLNVGGVIVQNVIGQLDIDEDFNEIIHYDTTNTHGSIIPPHGQTLAHWTWNNDMPKEYRRFAEANYDLYSSYPTCLDYLFGDGKGEPDIYYFNFLNYTGKFYIDHRDMSVHILDKMADIRFEKYDEKWKAITPDGAQYFFTENEFIEEIGEMISPEKSIAYKLSKIIFPNGKTLNFDYENIESLNSLVYLSESYTYDIKNFSYCNCGSCLSSGNTGKPGAKFYENQKFSINRYNVKNLTRIYSDDFNEDIIFSYSTRADILSEKKLDSITILKGNGNYMKSFEFKYGYFESSDEGNVWWDGNDITRRKRLRLDTLRQKGLPAYIFSYSDVELPSKLSYAQDYWGYYNGRLQNESVLSNFWSFFYFREQPSAEELPWSFIEKGSLHACDTSFIQAGILKKVKYPTGGVMELEYESNSFGNHFYPSVAQIEEYNEIKNNQTINETKAAEFYAYDGGTYDVESFFFEVAKPSKVTVNYTFNWGNSPGGFSDIKNSFIGLQKTTAVGTPISYVSQVYANQPEVGTYYQGQILEDLEEGYYKLYAYIPTNAEVDKYCSIVANISVIPDEYVFPEGFGEISYGGGIRVKSIVNTTKDGSAIKTKFDYGTGILMSPLDFYFSEEISYAYLDHRPTSTSSCAEIIEYDNRFRYCSKTSSSLRPLSYDAYGGLVGYGEIKIKKGNIFSSGLNNTNGYVKKEYYVNPPISKPGSPNIPNPQNGKLKKISNFNNDNILLKALEYNYEIDEHNRIYGHKAQLNRYCGYFDVYPIISNSINLIHSKEYNYDANGIKYGEIMTDYAYNDYNMLINVVENTSVDSINVQNDKTYIGDIIDATGVIKNMQNAHVISSLISETIKVNDVKTYESTFDYELGKSFIIADDGSVFYSFNNNLITVLPTGVVSDEQIINISYDLDGNIVNVLRSDGIPTSYFWAYNNSYPVIKAENAEYDVLGTNNELFGAVLNAPRGTSGTIEDFFNSFNNTGGFFNTNGTFNTANKSRWEIFHTSVRNTLPNALISFYTYDPLIGMTSQTDPNGKTTYYEYDSFGRLKYIKDHKGNVLKKYDYHYANTNP